MKGHTYLEEDCVPELNFLRPGLLLGFDPCVPVGAATGYVSTDKVRVETADRIANAATPVMTDQDALLATQCWNNVITISKRISVVSPPSPPHLP